VCQIAIALASNIGGMASPISSPQNLIALGAMEPALDWLQWFAISLPVASCSLILVRSSSLSSILSFK
jgi:phosphate transporter